MIGWGSRSIAAWGELRLVCVSQAVSPGQLRDVPPQVPTYNCASALGWSAYQSEMSWLGPISQVKL